MLKVVSGIPNYKTCSVLNFNVKSKMFEIYLNSLLSENMKVNAGETEKKKFHGNSHYLKHNSNQYITQWPFF